MTWKRVSSGLLIMLLYPSAAWAHPGPHVELGFLTGFVHPFTGFDHLLAMTAVGLFATHLGGRALWAIPTAFIAGMIAGEGLSASGAVLPMVEPIVAASVLTLGVLIAMQARLGTLVAVAMASTFAVFHGYAHGAEMPASSSVATFTIGFVAATAVLHAAGIASGLAMRNLSSNQAQALLRIFGGLLIGAGVALSGSAI